MHSLHDIIVNQWYTPKPWGKLLWPAAKIFEMIVNIRRYLYKKGIFKTFKAAVPVIIVGNVTVGGTGKTPLVIALSEILHKQGIRVGIVLRGYKSKACGVIVVKPNMNATLVGDEAVLLAKRSNCPVVVAKKRVQGVKKLCKQFAVDVILCDDGLQHYALSRDIEIAVLNGDRKFGNGHCLPQGPLRELPSRLDNIDMVITNGKDMRLQIDNVYSLLNKKSISIADFNGKTVHAIAGIGTPQNFFTLLEEHGIKVITHAFPDHHVFKMSDVIFRDNIPVLMTEKDAVKCSAFASEKYWVVSVATVLDTAVKDKFMHLVQGVLNGR